ncbi:hypothetical protein BaRGS_00038135, partial [Batillaria attramentaria]
SLLRIMQELMAVWLLCVLAGTSCAVFYTKSTDNDYPRIGRRAFFTGTAGSGYPRIGRSSIDLIDPSDVISDLYLTSNNNKRGIFTQGGHGFPRIGRAGSDMGAAHAPGMSSAAAEAAVSSVERSEVAESEEVEQFEMPLGVLFFEFDKNGDKTLSREEFATGMRRAREEGTLCR